VLATIGWRGDNKRKRQPTDHSQKRLTTVDVCCDYINVALKSSKDLERGRMHRSSMRLNPCHLRVYLWQVNKHDGGTSRPEQSGLCRRPLFTSSERPPRRSTPLSALRPPTRLGGRLIPHLTIKPLSSPRDSRTSAVQYRCCWERHIWAVSYQNVF